MVGLKSHTSKLYQELRDDPQYRVGYNPGRGGRPANTEGRMGGYRLNEMGEMMGVHHPVMVIEHQHFVTEDIPAIITADHLMPFQ